LRSLLRLVRVCAVEEAPDLHLDDRLGRLADRLDRLVHGLGNWALNNAAPLGRRLRLIVAALLHLLRCLLNAAISARRDRRLVRHPL
jgi:hypothetical protein